MNILKLIVTKITLIALLIVSTVSQAAPVTLNGMGIQKQWIDYEGISGDMPDFVWGNSDTESANSIGLYVEFANGIEGSIVYTGVSSYWNSDGEDEFGTLISATGFFQDYTRLHFLYNTEYTTDYGSGALPIAWIGNPSTPFGSNIELDYNEQGFNSQFRISDNGWNSVQITTYSSSAVPVPAAAWLFGSALAGLGVVRRKK